MCAKANSRTRGEGFVAVLQVATIVLAGVTVGHVLPDEQLHALVWHPAEVGVVVRQEVGAQPATHSFGDDRYGDGKLHACAGREVEQGRAWHLGVRQLWCKVSEEVKPLGVSLVCKEVMVMGEWQHL